MQNNSKKEKVKGWLLARGISEAVLYSSGLKWDEENSRIVIPIRDSGNRVIFNKYRRDPLVDSDEPKYRYDVGSSVSLYNIDRMGEGPIFIVEGELDCLLMNSLGHNAVTSTGGAGTFQEEWAPLFDGRDTYILLDNDNAGLRGSLRIQRMIPHAKWLFIPEGWGKDITDAVRKRGVKALAELESMARSYRIPEDMPTPPLDKRELKALADSFMEAALEIRECEKTDGRSHLAYIKRHLLDRNVFYKILHKRAGEQRTVTSLEDVKRIPITNFVAFNREGFAKCLWHTENTPSMKYNGEGTKYPNTVYCFGGCAKMYDVISVYMALKNCDFKEAVKQLKR